MRVKAAKCARLRSVASPLHHHHRRHTAESSNPQCDGAKPCSRCRARHVVCVYGKADTAKLALSMTPQRAAMLQEQNDRLIEAVRRMAARLGELESRHDEAGCGNCHDYDRLHESPAAAQHADITEILDRYAPSPAASAAWPRSPRSSRCGETTSAPQQPKRRRVEDQDGEPYSPSHMIVPASQLQPGQMIENELAIGSAPPNHTDNAGAAATSNPDIFDSHSTAYQTLLLMSHAHKSRATQLRGQGGVIVPDIANSAHAMPASIGLDARHPSLSFAPDPLSNGSTAVDADFPDALFDLVDWNMSLQNCDPINWDWANCEQ